MARKSKARRLRLNAAQRGSGGVTYVDATVDAPNGGRPEVEDKSW